MNRPIKFRAWDVENQTWTFVTLGDLVCGACLSSGDKSLSGGPQIWEQSTGLKDKNSKEIYEGDILRTTDRVTVKDLIFPIGVVEFKQQAFWICNVPSERPDFTHNETLLKYWETDLEVIGNIHENPELLGGEG